MLYFIPAWYLKDCWREDEQFWYRRRMKSEMDDTVKQIQLFQRNDICGYKILLLSHAPNFRHFLHRQSIFRVPYWSVFDAIQEVRRKKQAVLSFHNLNWPEGIEFIYTPFTLLAMLRYELYANIQFGEYGNPIEIDLFRNGEICRKNMYDDRGFISCTSVYENGKKTYDQYLTEKGVWKLCHFADGHVKVNPKSNQYLIRTPEVEERLPFLKDSYASMEEVIEEVFASGLRTTKSTDIFCAAAHEQHLALLDRVLADRKTIFSIYEQRLAFDGSQAAVESLSHGDYIVTDSKQNLEAVSRQKELECVAKANISLYDTRVDFGISQQLNVQKILFPVDRLPAETLEAAVKYMAAYLKRNKQVRVHLFTRDASFERKDMLLRQVGEVLEQNGYPPEWAGKKAQNTSDVRLPGEEPLPVLFAVEQCVNALEVNKCMREQRLLVDLADSPDLFLQISCVSMGIPQVLKTTNEYMRPAENGRINRDISKLGEDLAYYLESLGNWNQAAIQSYGLGKVHTTQNLTDQWKEVIVHIEKSTGITAGDE